MEGGCIQVGAPTASLEATVLMMMINILKLGRVCDLHHLAIGSGNTMAALYFMRIVFGRRYTSKFCQLL